MITVNTLRSWQLQVTNFLQPGYDEGDPVHRRRGRIETLEAIRVLMVLWVIEHHYLCPYLHDTYKEDHLGPFWGRISRGLTMNNQASCYAFIALSGFITHWTSRHTEFDHNPRESIPAYWKRRLGRIFFSYECAALLGYIVSFPGFCPRHQDVANHNKQSLWTFLGIQSWWGLYGEQVSFDTILYVSPPLWTISTLFFCWFMYPIYNIIFVRKRNTFLSVCGILLWTVFMFGAFTRWPGPNTTEHTREGPWQGWYWFPPLAFPTFAVGIHTAEFTTKFHISKRDFVLNVLFGFLGMASFVLFMLLNMYDWDIVYAGVPFQYVNWGRLFLALIPVIFAAAGAEALVLGGIWCAPLHALGEYSLALYVFQNPIFSMAKYAIDNEVEWWPTFTIVPHFLLSLIVCIAWSVGFVEWVEKPLWGMRRSADTSAKSLSPETMPLVQPAK